MAAGNDKGGRKTPNARARAAALREQQRKKEARRRMLLIGGIVSVVVVVVVVMVIIATTGGKKKGNQDFADTRAPAPAAAVKQVTTIPAADFEKVDTSSVISPPKKVSGSPYTVDGKPGVLYYGAEYCPYCAAERWPFVVALSRFGTWSNLQQTASSATDTNPNTATFSFTGAKYSSQYVGFAAVETETNTGKPLEKANSAQQSLLSKYAADSTGSVSIPFIDFGNKYTIQGGTYDSTILDGKSFEEIASAVADPQSKIGKAVLGNANVMTGAICEMTNGKPANVCDASNIKTIRTALQGLGK